jgi:uncharacterized protein YkwD
MRAPSPSVCSCAPPPPASSITSPPTTINCTRRNCSTSKCSARYLALAETLVEDGVPLLTADTRLARAAEAHSDIEVLLVG